MYNQKIVNTRPLLEGLTRAYALAKNAKMGPYKVNIASLSIYIILECLEFV